MTNTLHRYGAPETQKDDYILFAIPTRANRDGSLPKLKAFLEIAKKHGPVSIGGGRKGSYYRPSEHLTPLAHWRRNGCRIPKCFSEQNHAGALILGKWQIQER